MTRHPDLFAALAAPFAPGEVKVLALKGRKMDYITARTAMNRLDDVLGPENWWDEYIPGEKSVLCRLTICLPDGQTLTKCDAGGYAGMADAGDDDKSGYSDAFKRAAAKFGVARYLYRDGVPRFAGAPCQGAEPATSGDSAPAPAPAHPGGRETWSWWIGPYLARFNAAWLREMTREGIDPHVRREYRALGNEPREVNAICTKLVEARRLDPAAIARDGKPDVRDPKKCRAVVMELFERSPGVVKRFVEKHLKAKRSAARAALGMPDLDDEEEEGSAEGVAGSSNGEAGAA